MDEDIYIPQNPLKLSSVFFEGEVGETDKGG